jgi:hypothetical protein
MVHSSKDFTNQISQIRPTIATGYSFVATQILGDFSTDKNGR